jgi:FkbH-like protein
MHDGSAAWLLDDYRRRFADRPPSVADIFSAGEAILALDRAALPADLPTQRIAIAGALTTDFLARAIALGVAQEGTLAEVYQAPFGSYVQEILDPSSGLNQFKPDLVVLAPDWREMVEALPITATQAEADSAINAKIDLFCHLWSQLVTNLNCRILQHNLSPPPRNWGGTAEYLATSSPASQIRHINDGLLTAGTGRVTFVDLAALAADIGIRKFSPNRFYHNSRLGFETRWLPQYLSAFRGAWRLAHGRVKKVLALDLDNTLWGGVIGDDGVDGIVVGAGSPAGEAFAEWQGYISDLRRRGVILAVCSKNDPAIAATGFDHPQTVLRRDDFAAFECSWHDKAQGLRRIAATLNLGLDSVVFCDDNPAECALVRAELPEIAVVPLGADPSAFIDLLDAGHWFDQTQYTAEDAGRAGMYAARSQADGEAATTTDIGGFLRGLKMVGKLVRPTEADIARVAQLEMKTNQFNLTTRRYSEAALRAMLARDDVIILSLRLSDRFGDHGLVATLIGMIEGDTLRIDSFLMSCRVFGRGAEQFILQSVCAIAAIRGARRIIGHYVPTAKNSLVADLWPRLGFVGHTDRIGWTRDVATSGLDGLDNAIQSV